MQRADPFTRNRIIPRGQIAIEPAAPSVRIFRDFVHCRFADAGRPLRVAASVTAGIRKPLQEQKLLARATRLDIQ